MTADGRPQKSDIGRWLKENPLPEQEGLDAFGVPEELFLLHELTGLEKQADRFIRTLVAEDQKLLFYISRDLAPDLIREVLPFDSPEQYWIRKEQLMQGLQKSFGRDITAEPGNDLITAVTHVFMIREKLAEMILVEADVQEKETEKIRNKRRARVCLLSAPVILLLAFVFIYPALKKPDILSLFAQYKTTFQADTTAIDTTQYAGNRFYQAMDFFLSDELPQARTLFEELISEGTEFQVTSRWYLALIFLHEGNKDACREQLKLLKEEDPAFFNEYGKKLHRKIN
ncbi:MAG: hypothetical protein A2X22_07725 [Bacteroidetes bacterium GWF2_49_14]|nr:MAG: hypothetical protein A2X22_07725 [Bacteroidetes bacterium GWF2_49_14]HBB92912.1 hypothetical protein [Bacteroidales bacterium]